MEGALGGRDLEGGGGCSLATKLFGHQHMKETHHNLGNSKLWGNFFQTLGRWEPNLGDTHRRFPSWGAVFAKDPTNLFGGQFDLYVGNNPILGPTKNQCKRDKANSKLWGNLFQPLSPPAHNNIMLATATHCCLF